MSWAEGKEGDGAHSMDKTELLYYGQKEGAKVSEVDRRSRTRKWLKLEKASTPESSKSCFYCKDLVASLLVIASRTGCKRTLFHFF